MAAGKARIDSFLASPASYIDHTILKPTATQRDIEQLCAEALEFGFATVCVNTRWLPLCQNILKNAPTKLCAVVGFPLGACSSQAKAFEASFAVREGAQEIDMVISIGDILAGHHELVESDISAVVQAVSPVPVKVIIETCLLPDDETKRLACQAAVKAAAAFVKTSTGFSTGGATAHDVRLMRATVGESLGVKASGGVRTLEDAKRMVEAGASRVGTSNGVAIMKDWQALQR